MAATVGPSVVGPIGDSEMVVDGETVFAASPDDGSLFSDVDACWDCPRPRKWVSVDFLLWWRRAPTFPPLVTTSPVGTGPDEAGQLDRGTTDVLLGGDAEGVLARPGGMVEFGTWFDEGHCLGVGGRFFALGNQEVAFQLNSNTNPIIARPFLNVTDGQPSEPDTLLVAFPGESTGSVQVRHRSEFLGADAYARGMLVGTCGGRLDLVGGYEFMRLNEGLSISNNLVALSTAQLRVPGSTLTVLDQFNVTNEFHAGLVGLMGECERGRFSMSCQARVGFGTVRQEVRIRGLTRISDGTNVAVDAEGLLARATNSGTFHRNQFAVAPDVGLKIGYAISPCWSLTTGYQFMFWSKVIQASDTLDRDLAVNLATPRVVTQRPEFRFSGREYWVQGVSIGLQAKF